MQTLPITYQLAQWNSNGIVQVALPILVCGSLFDDRNEEKYFRPENKE
jgi:hypothetical protein